MRVIVIGAGVIGSAIALELRLRGTEVLLIEANAIGGHTSTASAGMVNPFSLTPHETPALPFYLNSLRFYPQWAHALYEQTGIGVEWREEGCWEVALTEADSVRLQSKAAWVQRHDPHATIVEGAVARQSEPALGDSVMLALYLPHEGSVNTERLMTALRRAVQLSGANLYPNTPVLALEWLGRGVWGVHTAHGVLESDAIVLAAGAWTSTLLRPLGVHTPIEPVRGVILHLGELPQLVRSTLVSHTGYIVPRKDGTALVGATREQAGYDLRATAQGYAHLLRGLAEIAPTLLQAAMLGHTVGLRPDTPDHNPYIGSISGYKGLYIAAGHAYHGVLMAPATARVMADLVLNSRTMLPIEPFNPNRFMR
ncbi:MAG: putative D-amino acid oxidase [Fimbriimonadales bacterium]|nr:MAG: putative D-amino acid oxidase [Fimbriimonadales bacterium]